MKNKSVTCIMLGDKLNYNSAELSIDFFQKTYGDDGEIILINTQHEEKYTEIGNRKKISVIYPSIKLDYPIFKLNEFDDLWRWVNECFLKPMTLAESDYVTFSEPDCFIINKTDFSKYSDYDCISAQQNPLWWFVALHYNLGGDIPIGEVLQEMREVCNIHNINFDSVFEKDFLFWFTPGSFIKTKSIQKLLINNKHDIYEFTKKIINLLDKKCQLYNCKTYYMFPDVFFSMILHFYDLKTVKNTNAICCNPSDIYNTEIYTYLNSSTEIVHPLKTYYMNKSQACGYYVQKKMSET